MPRPATVAVSVCATLFLLSLVAVLTPSGRAATQEIQRVFVTNFPETQKVRGTVGVEGTVRHGALVSVKEIQVPPVDPKETGRLIDGGIVQTDGFTSVVLSLTGQTQGKVVRSGGAIGAILTPEEESIVAAFEEDGQVQFPLEVAATLTSLPLRSFASNQARFTIGFPRYRVRLYNTTEKTATINLFAYLTN